MPRIQISITRFLLTLTAFTLFIPVTVRSVGADVTSEVLQNGGFEKGDGETASGWNPFESGYEMDQNQHRNGGLSIRCFSNALSQKKGATVELKLNQSRATPLQIVGWSRAQNVSGTKNTDYSLYIDLTYTDGTTLWGLTAPFSTGTHDWERRQILVLPAKPIKSLTLYCLLRNHTGVAWFDDISATQLAGERLFDSQNISFEPTAHSPSVLDTSSAGGLTLSWNKQGDIVRVKTGKQESATKTNGGFFVRDAIDGITVVPMHGSMVPSKIGGYNIYGSVKDMQLTFSANVKTKVDAIIVDGEVTDTAKRDRAVTVYFAIPVDAIGWNWGQDIRISEKITSGREYTNQTRVNVGATGGISLYPFASITSPSEGIMISNQMDWPSVYRIFYNSAQRQFVIAWDFALTSKTSAWPARNARFRCRISGMSGSEAAWGFRSAASKFYKLNAPNYDRKAKKDGIWLPFTDPATVQNVQDFHFAYHEGDNSIKSDDMQGILSFRYTEPMSFWMSMPPSMPRTYENAIHLLNKMAESSEAAAGDEPGKPNHQMEARATINSGTTDPNGRFNLEFRNEPWANGAVFTLNPNPELPSTPDKPTKASISYSAEKADAMYARKTIPARGEQDGEYLDSVESWSDNQDYRLSNIAACPYPITFDTDSRRPCIPQWYATHMFARYLRDDLHNRGKLLFANSTPIQFSIFSSVLDVMGIEVNWLDDKGQYTPNSDEIFDLRRTLSNQKPYLLLQNTNFDKFTVDMVEKYMQRSMFYGVFPSMFSVDAASSPYWENPAWYNRDRALFKKYIPLVSLISAAGWEPVTHARSSNEAVWVERYGTKFFTVCNPKDTPQKTLLNIDLLSIGQMGREIHATELISGKEIPAQAVGSALRISLQLPPDYTGLIQLR